MRILIDMNLTVRWAAFLTDAGIEATHWSSIGSPEASDEVILAWCAERGLVLLTNDLDFPRLLALAGQSRPSVLVFRGDLLIPDARGNELLMALDSYGTEIAAGVIVMLDGGGRTRLRRLPIQ